MIGRRRSAERMCPRPLLLLLLLFGWIIDRFLAAHFAHGLVDRYKKAGSRNDQSIFVFGLGAIVAVVLFIFSDAFGKFGLSERRRRGPSADRQWCLGQWESVIVMNTS